jgi:hypothetical protein
MKYYFKYQQPKINWVGTIKQLAVCFAIIACLLVLASINNDMPDKNAQARYNANINVIK